MKYRRIAIVAPALALCLGAAVPAHADGDPVAGRKKAIRCQNCHGLDGLSKLPEAPNLAGQNMTYMIKQLGEFAAGVRKDPMMSLVAATLTPGDIADLTAYYSSIEITVAPPAH
ncbi:MAG: c-type cytochrome [Azospirillaceae bacterium]|nr:c-type cytochrome [Azospirillaceae bacterium]